MDGTHSVFGEVAEESLDVLRKINQAVCDEENIPYQDIRCAFMMNHDLSSLTHVKYPPHHCAGRPL